MKNTHHAEMSELLIARDLDWVEGGGIFREEPPAYQSVSQTPKPNKRFQKGRRAQRN